MSTPVPMESRRFGRLVVVAREGSYRRNSTWRCRCDCGAEVAVRADALNAGKQKTCGVGCRYRRLWKFGSRIFRSEYRAWEKMRARCAATSGKWYRYYGARGIRVVRRWQSFDNFVEDMGTRPSPRHSLDRIDNDRGYGPGNCRWATPAQQARNRRVSVWVRHGGRRVLLADLCERLGVRRGVVYARLRIGWSLGEAIGRPVRKYAAAR